MEHRYALIVGIDNYNDTAHFIPLPFAQADARALFELLVDPERGGWNPEDMIFLSGDVAIRGEIESQLREICRAVPIPVQVGGGLRDVDAVAAVLAAGAARVVVGTIAVRAPAVCAGLCGAHPGRVAVGLDARGGRIRVAGWTESENVDAVTVAARVAAMGAAAVIYTDVERDGTERGPDLAGTRAVARAARVPVIASGGVASLDDVRAMASLGVAGIIVGRALYTGAIRLADALAAAEAA